MPGFNPYVIARTDIVIGLINILFAAVVILKAVKLQKLHIGFVIVLVTYGLWDIIVGIGLLQMNNPETALFWNRMRYFAVIAAAASVTFAHLAFNRNLPPRFYIVNFGVAALLALLAHTGHGVRSIVSVYPLKITTGFFIQLIDLYMIIVLALCIVYFIRGYRDLSGVKKLQMEYILLGLILTLIVGILFGGVLPMMGHREFVDFAPLASIPFFITTGYAIFKRNLLGMEFVVFDLVRLVMVIAVLHILNFVIYSFAKGAIGHASMFSSSVSLIVVALLYFATPTEKYFSGMLRSVMLNRRLRYQKLLSDSSKAVTSILEVDRLLSYIIDSLSAALGSKKIAVFMKEDIDGEKIFRLCASFGLRDLVKNYVDNKRVLEWFEKNKRPFIMDMFWQEGTESENKDLIEFLEAFNAVLVVPLVYKNEVMGLITLDHKRADGAIFDIDDVEILESLASSLAVALENAKMYTNLNNSYMSITRSLAVAVETRDPYMVGHSDNVTKYTLAIAKKMNITGSELTSIIQAAMLHDLGKIGVHDYILTKPGKLTEEEWVEMKLHTVKGSKILEPLPFMREVSRIIRYHHERYDGTGYPEGLVAMNIPVGSQILTVADSFDAMMSPRVYRSGEDKKYSLERTISELRSNKGSQFNPKIVDMFIDILEQNPEIISKSSGIIKL